MSAAEVVEFVSGYASATAAPVRTQTTVTSVRRTDDGYQVAADTGDLRCRCLVLASGACNVPTVPALCQGVPASIECVTPLGYRSSDQLPDGGVLVVGASATGVQLAEEIHPLGSTGDPLGRRARAAAEDLPRPRRAVVDGRIRCLERALRPDRRPQPCPRAAIAATGGDTRACDARPERFRRPRRRVGAEDDARDLTDHLAGYLAAG